VKESDRIQITGGNIGHYDESSYLSLGRDANGFDIPCFVTVSVPGQGGPEMMIGEKVPTTVNGSPGFRNSAGAEGPYLMWRHRGSWTMVHCSSSDGERFLEEIADAVEFRPSSIKVPFGLRALAEGYRLSSVISDLNQGSHAVYLGPVDPAFGLPDSDVVIAYEAGASRVSNPIGQTITVNGRAAVLNAKPESPRVCLSEQQNYICVGVYVRDTGPYPDRSGEIPMLVSLAEGLRFAADLDDRSTWFAAERVFPK
jgi:hypothetical protein